MKTHQLLILSEIFIILTTWKSLKMFMRKCALGGYDSHTEGVLKMNGKSGRKRIVCIGH